MAPRVQHSKGHSRGHRAPPKIQRDCGTVRSKKMLHKAQRRQRARRRLQHPHTSQGQRDARTAAGGHHPKLSHGLRAQRSGTSGGNELASLLCVHQNYGNINCACPHREPNSDLGFREKMFKGTPIQVCTWRQEPVPITSAAYATRHLPGIGSRRRPRAGLHDQGYDSI